MEVPANRYPWENRPFDYIKAFYHIDSLIAEYAPETRVVWGPAGYPGALEFWPENADLASITLGSKSEKRVNAYPDYKDAGIELKRKLHRMRFIDVPVLVLAREDHVPSKKNLYEIESERRIHSDLYALNKSTQTIIHRDSLILGLYDPNALLLKTENLSAEHIFTDFEQISDSTLISKILAINERGHDAIVSFEPMYPTRSVQDRKVLNKTISGEYDSLFNLLFSQLNQLNGRLFLRFAHEMEIPITRYPWQSQDPVLYIDAFRYFMERASEYLPHAVRIWGPAGDRGSEEWYPGDEYVDLISIAIYGLPDKNITDPSQQESFGTIFNRKYRRMRFIRKPVFITEFGVKGPEIYQDNWLDGAADVIRENPQIIGINYFNMIDNPEVWGEGMKAPDWSLTRESWLKFNQSLIDQVGKRD
jgi:beta-mannanase